MYRPIEMSDGMISEDELDEGSGACVFALQE